MEQFEREFYMIRMKNVTGRYIDIAGLYDKEIAERKLKKYQKQMPKRKFKLQPHTIKFKK